MSKDKIDRLLEEGLRNYSRVEPPEDFAARLRERIEATARPASLLWRWWLWVPAPLAAAALVALWAVLPPPTPVAPPVVRAVMPVADLRPTAERQPKRISPVAGHIQVVRWRRSIRVLSPEELASLQLPADLFPKEPPAAELTIPDLSVPELKIPALESEPGTPESRGSDVSK